MVVRLMRSLTLKQRIELSLLLGRTFCLVCVLAMMGLAYASIGKSQRERVCEDAVRNARMSRFGSPDSIGCRIASDRPLPFPNPPGLSRIRPKAYDNQ